MAAPHPAAARPPILLSRPDVVVLNKPAGLPVHPGPRGGPSVEDWFPALSRRRTGPWLAHRLDADTAGCLLVALRRPALLDAQRLFAAGQARKTYWAVVAGQPAAAEGTVDAPLAKRHGADGWWMAVDPAGQPARSTWRLLGSGGGRSWLELRPRTGRTHQLRVHCAAIGHPIEGDARYGGGGAGPLMLLARGLALALAPPLAATAPVPPHMRDTLHDLGWCGEDAADAQGAAP